MSLLGLFFTKVDTTVTYWSIILVDVPSMLTIFDNLFGSYRILQLPLGFISRQSVFKCQMDQIVEWCKDATGISSDVTVHVCT